MGLVGEEGGGWVGWVGRWGEGRGTFDKLGGEDPGGEVVAEEEGRANGVES